MGTSKKYVATQSFTIALDGGKKAVSVNPGDEVDFDGVTATVGGETGEARVLAKVIGDWIDVPSKAKVSAKAPVALSSRNRTGGQIVEGSDPSAEVRVASSRDNKPASADYELAGLVEKYENSSGKTIMVSSDDELKEEAKQQRRIMNSDDDIVATVREPSQTGTEKNTSGVQLDKSSEKHAVLSEDQKVVKQTTYPDVKKQASTETHKKLPVEKEGQGVEVSKKKTAKAPTAKAASTKRTVIREDTVVKNVSARTPQHTDVGSTTQASTSSAIQQESSSSDGVVVGKVRSTSEVKEIEGMTVRATTGAAGEMTPGEVKFSDGDAQMQEPGVIFSGGGDTPVDLSSLSDDDLDVTALLGGDDK